MKTQQISNFHFCGINMRWGCENLLLASIFCQKIPSSDLKSQLKHDPVMVCRVSFIIVFLCGVAVALLGSFLPNISSLLGLTPHSERPIHRPRLPSDERYGIFGKGDIPSFYTSTLAVKKPQELEVHPGRVSSEKIKRTHSPPTLPGSCGHDRFWSGGSTNVRPRG